MIVWVCLALVGLAALTVLGAFSALRALERRYARREDQLINQILYLSGRPWQRPPASLPEMGENLRPLRATASPEQRP